MASGSPTAALLLILPWWVLPGWTRGDDLADLKVEAGVATALEYLASELPGRGPDTGNEKAGLGNNPKRPVE